MPELQGKAVYSTYEEAVKLIAAVDQKALHLVVGLVDLAVQTGCRKKELLELAWDRVDWKNNGIILEAKHTKSAKPRKVPINSPARSVLI